MAAYKLLDQVTPMAATRLYAPPRNAPPSVRLAALSGRTGSPSPSAPPPTAQAAAPRAPPRRARAEVSPMSPEGTRAVTKRPARAAPASWGDGQIWVRAEHHQTALTPGVSENEIKKFTCSLRPRGRCHTLGSKRALFNPPRGQDVGAARGRAQPEEARRGSPSSGPWTSPGNQTNSCVATASPRAEPNSRDAQRSGGRQDEQLCGTT